MLTMQAHEDTTLDAVWICSWSQSPKPIGARRRRPSADPYFTRRRRRREKFGVLPARRRTDAADKIRRKSARRDKFLMKFVGIPAKHQIHELFGKKYVFFFKKYCVFFIFSVVTFES
jgi:hypothetical protein